MQPTLVILAAGMASRYGSLKQVQGFVQVVKRLWNIAFTMQLVLALKSSIYYS
jgi:CTP:molybdopterin cytidylyltransferase MocA